MKAQPQAPYNNWPWPDERLVIRAHHEAGGFSTSRQTEATEGMVVVPSDSVPLDRPSGLERGLGRAEQDASLNELCS